MVEQVIHSYQAVLDEATRLVDGLLDTAMVERVAGLNPPAWILRHLAYGAQMMAAELGLAGWLSEEWIELFRTGSTPGKRTSYPSREQLLAAFDDAEERLSAAMRRAGEAGLNAPLPDERCRATMPTIGHALVQVLIGHTAMHVGLLSAWHRARTHSRCCASIVRGHPLEDSQLWYGNPLRLSKTPE